MAKRITNLVRQGVPFQYWDGSGLRTRILRDGEAVVVADTRISQYITDLVTAGHFAVEDTNDTPTTGFE